MKWHPFGPLLVGSAGALLIGCSVGPAYHRPDIAAPAQWRESAAGSRARRTADWPAPIGGMDSDQPQLDELIAEAQRNNDDLAAAVARVQEADAQARIAGAALLPSLDLGATATRERARTSRQSAAQVFNTFNPELTASYETRFLGQESRAARCRPRGSGSEPLRSANDRTDRRQQRRDDVLSSARVARPHPGGAAESRQRPDNPPRIQGRTIRGHCDRARRGAAGDRSRAAECRVAAAAAAISPDRVCARRAHRQDSGVGRCRRRHARRICPARRSSRACRPSS